MSQHATVAHMINVTVWLNFDQLLWQKQCHWKLAGSHVQPTCLARCLREVHQINITTVSTCSYTSLHSATVHSEPSTSTASHALGTSASLCRCLLAQCLWRGLELRYMGCRHSLMPVKRRAELCSFAAPGFDSHHQGHNRQPAQHNTNKHWTPPAPHPR